MKLLFRYIYLGGREKKKRFLLARVRSLRCAVYGALNRDGGAPQDEVQSVFGQAHKRCENAVKTVEKP